MPQWLERWNRSFAKWLWVVVLIGLVGTLPLIYARMQTEASAKKVEFVMDYRDLLQASMTQPDPQSYVDKQLTLLKSAGVNAMSVYESTLEELVWAGEVSVFGAQQAAMLEGKLPQVGDNRTYLLFNKPEDEVVYRPMIEAAFAAEGVSGWSAQGRDGLLIGTSPDYATMRAMQPNPLAIQKLRDLGFLIVPRLSDRLPYNDEEIGRWIDSFKANGVTRIIFDGDAVTGYSNQAAQGSLNLFAERLKQAGIGIGAIENLKAPQKGFGTLSKLLDYDVVRVHSVSEAEMSAANPSTLADRFLLAVKDRNLRMIYLNAMAAKDVSKGQINVPIDTIAKSLAGPDGAIKQIGEFGFVPGEAHAFDVHKAPVEKLWKALAILGAVALIALTIGLFIPAILVPVTIIGLIGGAGVLALSSSLLDQALALATAIAAPTAAMALLIRWLRTKHDRKDALPRSAWARLGGAILLYVRTSVISVFAVPFVIALLNDITYELVLQQFRGVSLLHLAPIALVALYAVLYGYGSSVRANVVNLLKQPITVLWVAVIAVVGAMGMYYLSRTGNGGAASGLELQFRSFLESTFGVRPRTKEFLLGHPIFLVGLFIALRYRWGLVLIVAATIGQLSMVDTFAHIHTPVYLSAMRDLLGLALGGAIGLVGIAVWRIVEVLWQRYGSAAIRRA
ncbi:DUF5693 domain-containing protein [Cohnella lubricantis]|uniref:DUF5693 family protein n=1 Tax=Cohnella lubricantis TaxID=2163172 RepID=UPI00289309DE|nr:DUF5693 family protein [Cohnella lubricantis]MBP2117843.1 hypothetical protein [Cohnella lubricantis]